MTGKSYDDFDATELYCPKCKRAVPVRKRLLLVLTGEDRYDYTCVYCGTSIGDKTIANGDSSGILMRS
ncbi:MAG: cytoplasmic protein [Thermodesulfobacteriota bacterium]|nr:cytoplasmic protein [Thermodesulfobacteriota bacterium]